MNVCLVGVDAAGGIITGPGSANWTWDGVPISLLGDSVASHGRSPHDAAMIADASPWFTIDGVPVTRTGSMASCGHAATGSAPLSVPE